MLKRALIVAALAGLAACGSSKDKSEGAGAPVKAGAEGKAEEGRLSIKGPGVDLAINVPDALRGRVQVDADSGIMPPGAAVSGMHVQGDGGNADGGRDSVELRFSVREAPGRVVAWYRDPARARDFAVASASREGEEIVLTGTSGEGGPFTVRLSARSGGGTDGRLVLVDRN
jgi:hypothetical protein